MISELGRTILLVYNMLDRIKKTTDFQALIIHQAEKKTFKCHPLGKVLKFMSSTDNDIILLFPLRRQYRGPNVQTKILT